MSEPVPVNIPPTTETESFVAALQATVKEATPEKKNLFVLVRDDGYPPVNLESADLDELFRQARAEMLKVRRGYAFFIIDGVRCPVCQPQQIFAVTTPSGNKLMGPMDTWVTDDTGKFEVLVEPPEME